MLENLEQMIRQATKACNSIKAYSGVIRVVSHYDADGITSASIVTRALQREGKQFHLTFVKQLEESVIQRLVGQEFLLFLDLGSGQLPNIEKYLGKAKRVVVIDHHQIQGEPGKNVIHVNPLEYEIEENVSGAGMCYLIARTLNPINKDLSELAIVGAIADAQMGGDKDWGLHGLNKEIVKDAVSTGKIKMTKGLRIWGKRTRHLHKALEYCSEPVIPGVTGSESGAIQFLEEIGIPSKKNGEWRTFHDLTQEEKQKMADGIIKARVQAGEKNPDWVFGDIYELPDKGAIGDANELATMINSTGKLDKAYMGLSLCWNDPEAEKAIGKLLERYRREIGKGLKWIQESGVIEEKTYGYYALCGEAISQDIISNVISILNRFPEYEGKPLIGFAQAGKEKVKISARAADCLVEQGVNLKEIMEEVAGKLGGEGGGHSAAAGATIPSGKEHSFINMVEDILSTHNGVLHDRENQANRSQESSGSSGERKGLGKSGPRGQQEAEGSGKEGSSGTKDSGNKKKGTTEQEAGKSKNRGNKKMEGKGLVRYFGS